MSINRIYILPVLIMYLVIPSLSCNEHGGGNSIADSIKVSDSISLIKSDTTTTGFIADSTIKKVTLLDTVWNGHQMSFIHLDKVKQDSLIVTLTGYKTASIATSEEFLDPDNANRLISIDNKWTRCPLVFIGDSLCAFSLINNIGTNRAMAKLIVADKRTLSLRIIEEDDEDCRSSLTGQTYFIVINATQGLCYIHSSFGPDSAEVYGRDVFKFRMTSCGFIKTGKPWRIIIPQYDTLLYPYDGSVEGYKKYFTKVFATHK